MIIIRNPARTRPLSNNVKRLMRESRASPQNPDIVKSGRTLTMRAGAGIVADSDPLREYQETINKSKAVFEAVKFAEAL